MLNYLEQSINRCNELGLRYAASPTFKIANDVDHHLELVDKRGEECYLLMHLTPVYHRSPDFTISFEGGERIVGHTPPVTFETAVRVAAERHRGQYPILWQLRME